MTYCPMRKTPHIAFVVGARPNFMKLCPMIREVQKYPDIFPSIIHTGQHYDYSLSGVFFNEFHLPQPAINFNVRSGTRDYQLETIRHACRIHLEKAKPDTVVIFGDVNSSLACAKAAHDCNISVAHIEAGLRSHDLSMPEEVNRIGIDSLSHFLFVTEEDGVKQLKKEGFPSSKIFLVGNIMIDNLLLSLKLAKTSDILSRFDLQSKEYAVMTLHRPINVDSKESLSKALHMLQYILRYKKVVFPLHPRTKQKLLSFNLYDRLLSLKDVIVTDPLGHLDFIQLLRNACCMVGDSASVQTEISYMNIPYLNMREKTECPITVSYGTNTLIGNSLEALQQAFHKVLHGTYKQSTFASFYDGKASERIITTLIQHLQQYT